MTNRENKRSLRQKIQDFMSTPKGQTIMNYAYNWSIGCNYGYTF